MRRHGTTYSDAGRISSPGAVSKPGSDLIDGREYAPALGKINVAEIKFLKFGGRDVEEQYYNPLKINHVYKLFAAEEKILFWGALVEYYNGNVCFAWIALDKLHANNKKDVQEYVKINHVDAFRNLPKSTERSIETSTDISYLIYFKCYDQVINFLLPDQKLLLVEKIIDKESSDWSRIVSGTLKALILCLLSDEDDDPKGVRSIILAKIQSNKALKSAIYTAIIKNNLIVDEKYLFIDKNFSDYRYQILMPQAAIALYCSQEIDFLPQLLASNVVDCQPPEGSELLSEDDWKLQSYKSIFSPVWLQFLNKCPFEYSDHKRIIAQHILDQRENIRLHPSHDFYQFRDSTVNYAEQDWQLRLLANKDSLNEYDEFMIKLRSIYVNAYARGLDFVNTTFLKDAVAFREGSMSIFALDTLVSFGMNDPNHVDQKEFQKLADFFHLESQTIIPFEDIEARVPGDYVPLFVGKLPEKKYLLIEPQEEPENEGHGQTVAEQTLGMAIDDCSPSPPEAFSSCADQPYSPKSQHQEGCLFQLSVYPLPDSKKIPLWEMRDESLSKKLNVFGFFANGARKNIHYGRFENTPDQLLAVSFSEQQAHAENNCRYAPKNCQFWGRIEQKSYVAASGRTKVGKKVLIQEGYLHVAFEPFYDLRSAGFYLKMLWSRPDKKQLFYYSIFPLISMCSALVAFHQRSESPQHRDAHLGNYFVDELGGNDIGFDAKLNDFDKVTPGAKIPFNPPVICYYPAQVVTEKSKNIDVYSFAFIMLRWLSKTSISERRFIEAAKKLSFSNKSVSRDMSSLKDYTKSFQGLADNQVNTCLPKDLKEHNSLYNQFKELIGKMLEHDPDARPSSKEVLSELLDIAENYVQLKKAPHWMEMPLYDGKNVTQIAVEMLGQDARSDCVGNGKRDEDDVSGSELDLHSVQQGSQDSSSDGLNIKPPAEFINPMQLKLLFAWLKENVLDQYLNKFSEYFENIISTFPGKKMSFWVCWELLEKESFEPNDVMIIYNHLLKNKAIITDNFPKDIIARLKYEGCEQWVSSLGLKDKAKLWVELLTKHPLVWHEINLNVLRTLIGAFSLPKFLRAGDPQHRDYLISLQYAAMKPDNKEKLIIAVMEDGINLFNEDEEVLSKIYTTPIIGPIIKDFKKAPYENPKAFMHYLLKYPNINIDDVIFNELSKAPFGFFAPCWPEFLGSSAVGTVARRQEIAEFLLSKRSEEKSPRHFASINYARSHWQLYEIAGRFVSIQRDQFWRDIENLYIRAFDQGVDLTQTRFLDHAIAFRKAKRDDRADSLQGIFNDLNIDLEKLNDLQAQIDPWKYYLLDARMALEANNKPVRQVDSPELNRSGDLKEEGVFDSPAEETLDLGPQSQDEETDSSSMGDLSEHQGAEFSASHINDLANALEADKSHRYFNTKKATSLCKTVSEVAHKDMADDPDVVVTLDDLAVLNAKKEACVGYVHTRKAVAAIITPLLFALLGVVLGATIGFILGMVSGPGAMGAAALGAIIGAKKFWMIGGMATLALTAGLPVTLWRRHRHSSDLNLSDPCAGILGKVALNP